MVEKEKVVVGLSGCGGELVGYVVFRGGGGRDKVVVCWALEKKVGGGGGESY